MTSWSRVTGVKYLPCNNNNNNNHHLRNSEITRVMNVCKKDSAAVLYRSHKQSKAKKKTRNSKDLVVTCKKLTSFSSK